jgi:hypothetical protein
MSTGDLMRELFYILKPLSEVEIVLEYGLPYLTFKIDATKKLKQLAHYQKLARVYMPIGNKSFIGLN